MAIKFVRRYQDDMRLYEAAAGPGRLLALVPTGYQYSSVGLIEAWSAPRAAAFVHAAGKIGSTVDTVTELINAVVGRVKAVGASHGFVCSCGGGCAALACATGRSSVPFARLRPSRDPLTGDRPGGDHR